jgi:hypothetical protein
MGSITTAMADTFKVELMEGGHCFNTTYSISATGTSGSTTLTLASVTGGIAVGMFVTGTGIAAGTAVASIPSSTTVICGPAFTGAVSGTVTFTADTFKMALIQATPSNTYNNNTNSANYSNIGADEVSGTGYTSTGQALTNVGSTPSGSPVQAVINFAPNPSWTTATFSTSGCMIYNTTNRVGTTGRGCGVFSFGGVQTVTAGTFTVVMPVASSSTAILRVA